MSEEIHVLYVEDDADFAELTKTFLERERDRFEIECAIDADTGLERLAEHDFDCVVSDYQMTNLNAIEFLEIVRDDDPDIPFILFTGKGTEEVASKAISAGVTDYLQKQSGTSQFDLLANRIANAVEQYRARRDREQVLERYRTVVENVGDPIYTLDTEGNIEMANQALVDLLGVEREAVIGEHVTAYIPERDFDRGSEKIRSLLTTNDRTDSFDMRIRPAHGGERIAETKFSIMLENGEFVGTVGVVRDITDRQEWEAELDWQGSNGDEQASIPGFPNGILDRVKTLKS